MYDWLLWVGLAMWAVLFITGGVYVDWSKDQRRKTSGELDANLGELKADLERSQRRFEEAMGRFQKVAQQELPELEEVTEYDQDGLITYVREVTHRGVPMTSKVCDRCGTVYDDDWCSICAVSDSQSRAKTEFDREEYERMMERARQELGISLVVPPPIIGNRALYAPIYGDAVTNRRSLPNVRPPMSRSGGPRDQREPNERPSEPPKSYPPPPPPPYTPPVAAEANEELPPPPVDPEAAKRWAEFVKRSQESS